MAEFMRTVDHGENPINLAPIKYNSVEAFPVELHHNTNGSITDEPTFAMVMQLPSGLNVFGQFSLKTLQDCLNELGYEIIKKEEL